LLTKMKILNRRSSKTAKAKNFTKKEAIETNAIHCSKFK